MGKIHTKESEDAIVKAIITVPNLEDANLLLRVFTEINAQITLTRKENTMYRQALMRYKPGTIWDGGLAAQLALNGPPKN